MRLIFSTLFGRRQKRCGLWLAVLQQLVMTCCKIEFKRSALGLPSSCASDVPTPIYYVWTDDIYSTSNKSSTGSRWKDIKASSTGILGTSLSRSTKSWKLSFSQRTNPTHWLLTPLNYQTLKARKILFCSPDKRIWGLYISIFTNLRKLFTHGAKYCNEHVSLSVCLSVCLSHQICACRMWLRLL